MTGCGTSRRRSYIALPLQVRRQQEQGGGKGLCLLAPLNGTRLSMKSKAFPLLFPFVTSFVPLLLLFACSLPFSSLFIPSLPVKNKMEKSTNGVRPTTNSKAFPLLFFKKNRDWTANAILAAKSPGKGLAIRCRSYHFFFFVPIGGGGPKRKIKNRGWKKKIDQCGETNASQARPSPCSLALASRPLSSCGGHF